MMFFAVGNQDAPEIGFPSSVSENIAVGAIDATGQRWRASSSFGSNFGGGLRYVAPGDQIFTTDRQGSAGLDLGNWVSGVRGTSFATPLVAGTAALIRALRPDLNAADVDTILCSTAVAVPNWDRIDDPDFEPPPECGLIDATAALTYALSYPPVFTDDFETGDLSRWTESAPP
jgi:subtilisin family serine protease